MLELTSEVRVWLDDIFSAVLIGGIKLNETNSISKGKLYNQAIVQFKQKFKRNIFLNEYALFYTLIMDAHQEVFRIESISSAINNNKKMILNSPYIDLDSFIYGYEDSKVDVQTDEMKLYAFECECKRVYEELNNQFVETDIGFKTFMSSSDAYIKAYINSLEIDIPHKMARIMSDDGYIVKMVNERSKRYQGFDDACKYYREQLNIINEFKDETNARVSTVIDKKWLEGELEEDEDVEDKGTISIGLEEIDEVIGKLRRTNMLGILGPPKGGKTKFTQYMVCRYLDAGYNVVVWPLEGTEEEWLGAIESNYIYKKYKIYISSKMIIEHDLSDEQKQLVNEAKMEIAIGKGRGKLSFINTSAYVEDFLDDLKTHYEQKNQYDVIAIDQMINILSRNKKPKAERIGEGYELLKNFLKTGLPKQVVAILPAQFKQSLVDWLRQHPNETVDVTAGGESANTVRTPDYIIGLFSTKEERNNGMMKIYDVASRHNGNFGDFYSACKLGSSYFWSEPELNNVFRG